MVKCSRIASGLLTVFSLSAAVESSENGRGIFDTSDMIHVRGVDLVSVHESMIARFYLFA